MLRTIYIEIATTGLIAAFGLSVWIYSVMMGNLPPLNPVCELRLTVARYEAVEPAFMDDANKEEVGNAQTNNK